MPFIQGNYRCPRKQLRFSVCERSTWVGTRHMKAPLKVLLPKELSIWFHKKEGSQGNRRQENLSPEVMGCFPGRLGRKRLGYPCGSDRGLASIPRVSLAGPVDRDGERQEARREARGCPTLGEALLPAWLPGLGGGLSPVPCDLVALPPSRLSTRLH